MTDPTRGPRPRRSTRRPGWFLLTTLLVLAIVASSALVFTNEVQLLKLAVILALWAAVVAAFISFIYRKQADVDQAKARDLKLVYDLQLDREISARREYELSIESHLRRELASELRTQNSDEVAGLRAELAALRANLEILFDTDFDHRPALETERTTVHTFGKVISSRIDDRAGEDVEPYVDENPIIDVPAERLPEHDWAPTPLPGGAHRRASEREPVDPPTPKPRAPEPTPDPLTWPSWSPPAPAPQPPAPAPSPPVPTWRPERVAPPAPAAADWPSWSQPAPAPTNGSAASFPTAAPVPPAPPPTPEPVMAPPAVDPVRARHATAPSNWDAGARRARHSAGDAADPGRPEPTLAKPAPPPPAPPPPAPAAGARHRGAEAPGPQDAGQHAGGQPVSELFARLRVGAEEGGRRRRRED